MNSDRFRECRHILASQENLERLPGFAQTPSIQEAAEVITRSRPKAVVRQCVSHLPIPPPIWSQLPTDIITGSILSHRLPEVFPFDNTARCSCGNSNYNAEAHTMTTGRYIVYTSTTAIQLAVETVYCPACSNTHGRIGPDLSNYGILNWNNKVGFTHQLLNNYTSHFTYSETPFNAYYRTIQEEYLNSQSPIVFCDDETFEYAWFAFIRLQKIQSDMRCSQCGDNPKVVIADGISVSFPGHHRTETLRPPTVHDKTYAWVRLRKTATRSTSFIGSNTTRRSIYEALNIPSRDERLKKLGPEIEILKSISVFFPCHLCLQTSGRGLRRLQGLHRLSCQILLTRDQG
jgi:hypothetical protein